MIKALTFRTSTSRQATASAETGRQMLERQQRPQGGAGNTGEREGKHTQIRALLNVTEFLEPGISLMTPRVPTEVGAGQETLEMRMMDWSMAPRVMQVERGRLLLTECARGEAQG